MQILPATRLAAAQQVFEAFFRHIPIPAGAVIAGYWPIRGEIDDMPILRELAQKGYACTLPYVVGEGMPLVFRAWDETTQMIPGRYGIPEPATDKALLPDIILVPMAAFDTKKHRLGYGAGFYDRTISYLNGIKPVLAVGLAFEEQKYDTLPAGDRDVKMDIIMTDRNIYQ